MNKYSRARKILEMALGRGDSVKAQSTMARHADELDLSDVMAANGEIGAVAALIESAFTDGGESSQPSQELDEESGVAQPVSFPDVETPQHPDFLVQVGLDQVDGGSTPTDIAEVIIGYEVVGQLQDRSTFLYRTPPLETKRQETRRKREKGEGYIGYGQTPEKKTKQSVPKPGKELKPRCRHDNQEMAKSSNHMGCCLVDDQDRAAVFEHFWSLEWPAKRAFVKGLVTSRCPKRRRMALSTVEAENKEQVKIEGHDCFLPRRSGEKVWVCRNMFLATLSLGRDTFQRWVRNYNLHPPTCISEKENVSTQESVSNQENGGIQGEKIDENKVKRLRVVEWLELIPKVPSHYCRATSSRVYVESKFSSILKMYSVYREWCTDKCHQPVCRQIFAEILDINKISIHHPRKDQCDACCSYEAGQLGEEEYRVHKEMKDEARMAKNSVKESCCDTKLVVTVDVQSVLLAPNLLASSLYYKQKLQVHNYTIYELNNKDVHLYVWHEGNGGVCANEFATCLVDYIRQKAVSGAYNNFVVISDGCGHQNRNKILTSALSDLACELQITIEQLYLERGHTMMEADSVHSTLEAVFRPPIYTPSDYVTLMKMARPSQPYTVTALDFSFFKDYENLATNFSSIRPGRGAGDPTVNNMRGLQYLPSGDVKYKLRHPENFTLLPQRRRSVGGSTQPTSLYDQPLEISAAKFKSLQDIKAVIPADYHPFYNSLSHM